MSHAPLPLFSSLVRPLLRAHGFLAGLPFRFRRNRIAPPAQLGHAAWAQALSARFNPKGLRALFNDALGFDLVESGMSNPIAGYFAHGADRALRYRHVPELYCHSEILCRKRCEVEGFDWSTVSLDGIVGDTRYPAPRPALTSGTIR